MDHSVSLLKARRLHEELVLAAHCRQLYVFHGHGCLGDVDGLRRSSRLCIIPLQHGTVEALIQTIVELGHGDFLECETLAKGLLHLLAASLRQDFVLVQAIAEGYCPAEFATPHLNYFHLAADGALLAVVLCIGGILIAGFLEDCLQIGGRELFHAPAGVDLFDAFKGLGICVQLFALLLFDGFHDGAADPVKVVLGHPGGHSATSHARSSSKSGTASGGSTDAIAVVIVVLAATQLRVHIVGVLRFTADIVIGFGWSYGLGCVLHLLHVRQSHLI